MAMKLIRNGKNKAKGILLSASKDYEVPKQATHLSVRGGQIFFWTWSGEGEYTEMIMKNFIKIPGGVKMVRFPDHCYSTGSHNYGNPKWN